MKKVLVIGGGGREHAIVYALSRSPQVEKIYCAPGNAGIAQLAECVAIKDTDVEGLLLFAKETEVDLTVVGPEAALAAGVVDAFRKEMAALGFSDEEMIEFFRKRCEVTGGTFTLERIG